MSYKEDGVPDIMPASQDLKSSSFFAFNSANEVLVHISSGWFLLTYLFKLVNYIF